jgi:hypothetical protein
MPGHLQPERQRLKLPSPPAALSLFFKNGDHNSSIGEPVHLRMAGGPELMRAKGSKS